MKYQWNPACLTRVFALPAGVVDDHIRLAGSAQLKVLLWLSRHGEGTFSPAACSEAIGLSAADCSDALQYWVENGVLLPAEEKPEEAEKTPPRTASVPEKAPEPPAPKPRPRAVKPSLEEVLARQKSAPEFAYLLDTASARLGRPISHGDMETLLYLFDTAGLPIEVILMVIAYAVSAEKRNMRYVEKVALDWADKGIDTVAAAEQYLCQLEKRSAAAGRVQALLGLERGLTVGQMEIAEKWVEQWRFSDALIRLAGQVCRDRIEKCNMAYVDRILEDWHAQGVDSAEKAEDLLRAAKAKKGAPPVENSSLDLDEYEKRVKDYVPVFRKKER